MATKNSGSSAGMYPYSPLPLCLPIAKAVSDLGGSKVAVSKHLLATHLKEDARGQSLAFKIASAKCFKTIEGRSEFMLTESGKRYFYPGTASEVKRALLEFLIAPPAFRHIIERFDGTLLPPAHILGNVIHKDTDVPVSWKERVAGFFIRSAQFAEVMDSSGFLRYKAALENGLDISARSIDYSDKQDLSEKTNAPLSHPSQSLRSSTPILGSGSNVWSFTHQGSTVRVETPPEMTDELWKKLDAYIKLLQPPKT